MNSHRFWDEAERRKWQTPEAILTQIGLRPGFTFIDVGCGSGYFTIPAAKLVGADGRVYGLDNDATVIRLLRQRARKSSLSNVTLKVGAAEKIILCDECADRVFFSLVLHDFTDPARVLMNAVRMVKIDGKIVDLDWKKEKTSMGPPVEIRFSEEKAVTLMTETGFEPEQVKTIDPYHYLIIARRR